MFDNLPVTMDNHFEVFNAMLDPKNLSDEKIIELFYAHRTDRGNKAEKTKQAYRLDILEFLTFLESFTGIKSFPLKNVNYMICNAYLEWLDEEIEVLDKDGIPKTDKDNRIIKQKRYSPATQSRRVTIAKALYSFGMELGYFTSTPWTLIKTPKANPTGKKTMKMLTVEQIEKIQEVARQDMKHDAIVSLFLSTGCRREELCHAKWGDISEHEVKSGKVIVWDILGKGKKARSVKIHPSTWEKILIYREKAGLPTRIGYDQDTPLICSWKEKKYSLSGLSDVISRIGKAAGVPELSCHSFRHTHGSMALADGSDVYKVQQQLGHSSLKITEGYLHQLEEFENTTADTIKRIKF